MLAGIAAMSAHDPHRDILRCRTNLVAKGAKRTLLSSHQVAGFMGTRPNFSLSSLLSAEALAKADAGSRRSTSSIRNSARWRRVIGGSTAPSPSLRAQRSNPESFRAGILDCFATLAMTMWVALRPTD